ncbi:MAG: EAL domain-containing protein [Gallionella sp.]|nr:EAL domain-containing protein [Gallionella sp.]
MNHGILPILYDLAVVIGGEVSLKPLLTHTLQRLLYYTSFPAGFVCLDLPASAPPGSRVTVRIDAVVGDFDLIGRVGSEVILPADILYGLAAREEEKSALLAELPRTGQPYQSYLRLPIDGAGVIVLLAPQIPETELPLTQMFQPVMAHLSKAILLCRSYDAYTTGLIRQRDQAEEQVRHMAFYDSLTGLPNRRLLTDKLQAVMSECTANGQHGALIFLDLDQFKTLNDTKGHDVGDLLLLEVSQRLRSGVADSDVVGRLGGDEFVVVLRELGAGMDAAVTQAAIAAEGLRHSLSQPCQLGQYLYHTTPSMGIVMISGENDPVDDLLKYADTAMYQAKTAGRNTISFYDPDAQKAIEARASIEDDLRSALGKQQLSLYYQIQVDDLGRVLGAEVLLRWQHPERGMVSPGEFIPLAEESGLIVPIGLWVLQTACAQLRTWQANPLARELVLAVNVSAKQFRQPDFVAQVQRVLLESGAKPSHLKLELTESIVLENVEQTITRMRELKMLGLSFSMDDFGTGYSSLQYLKRLPLDQIKIDQSFVRDIASDLNDAAIVQTIIAMGEALGLDVIAEGVETESQRDFLDKRGCHAFQGYLFGRPLPLDQFEAQLRLKHEALR